MTPRDQALELIGDIYDAAVQPERWPQTATKIASFVGASAAPLLWAPLQERHSSAPVEQARALTQLDEARQERVQTLLPHLMRAAAIMERLRQAQMKGKGAIGALDQLACGVVILDERGMVAFCNRAAQRILVAGDGLKLSASGDLFALDARAQKSLQDAVAYCLRPDVAQSERSRGLRVRRSPNRPDYVLQIASLTTRKDLRAASMPGAAIAFISDPDSELVLDEGRLRQLYGLTPAESRLAQLLLNGETLARAAERLGVSGTTAKTQLQHVFKKTNTHRQPELVKLLLAILSSN
jgi:DNA-binding CsgD family transcriptional regulator